MGNERVKSRKINEKKGKHVKKVYKTAKGIRGGRGTAKVWTYYIYIFVPMQWNETLKETRPKKRRDNLIH